VSTTVNGCLLRLLLMAGAAGMFGSGSSQVAWNDAAGMDMG